MFNKISAYQSGSFTVNWSGKYLILFILWPFLAFITAMSTYQQKESRKVIYLFLIYVGLTYFIGDRMDSSRVADRFIMNSSLPFSDFFQIVAGLYATETSIDIVEPFLSFSVSRFTSDPRFLFAVFAAVFGFFYLKSVNLLYEKYKENPGLNTLIYFAFFISVLSIHNINGFRMWAAAWVFFYGTYQVVLLGKPWYLLLTLASALVHWSFITANVVLILYYLAGNRNFIYFPLVFVSFLIPNLFVPFFESVSTRLGGAIQNRFLGYSDEDYIARVQEHGESVSWFLEASKNLIFYYLVFSIMMIFLFDRDKMRKQSEKNLFSFLLVFLVFVNFGTPIPSFGGRFQVLFILFTTLYLFLYAIKFPGKKLTTLSLLGILPMLLYAAIEFRIASNVLNSWIFLPGFGLPLFVPGIPLSDFLF